MTWIDDLNDLHEWLTQQPEGMTRAVEVSLVQLSNSGDGSYAEGRLAIVDGSIAGQVTRHRTKDRWDPFPNNQLYDLYPFNPNSVSHVSLSINVSSGAITVGSTTYAQPVSVAGSTLVAATLATMIGLKTHLTMSLKRDEQENPL